MTPNDRPQIYLPTGYGAAALDELDRVPWGQLAHAYGTGRVGSDLWDDVAATIRRFGDTDANAFADAVYAFFSNLCHQGTIYEATPFAVPFLAAWAAGAELGPQQVRTVVAMFACVGLGASSDAPTGSHAGSWGPGVAQLTQDALRVSGPLWAALARRDPMFGKLESALLALVRTAVPDGAAMEWLQALISECENE